MREEDLKVKYMSDAGTGMAVSGEWRKKHEERMKTVGVCRGEKEGEGEKGEEREKEEEGKPRLEDEEKASSLGDGWEW